MVKGFKMPDGSVDKYDFGSLDNKPDMDLYAEKTDLPTKVSDLQNDAGYLTTETDPTVPAWAKAATKPAYTAQEVGALPNTTKIPAKVSDLQNDSGFLTAETDPTVPQWAKQATKPSYTAQEVGALPGNTYIPTKVSDLDNDEGYLTEEVDPTVPAWAKQATKPSYTASEVGALPSTTHIPEKVSELQNDTGFITGYTETDPTVPAWAKAQSKPTYTAAEVGALPANTEIPTKVSDLQNDSGFLTAETDPTVPSWAKQPTKPTYTASEVGALPDTTVIPTKVSDLTDDSGHYTKPANGIPASDLAEEYVKDVQINGGSIVVDNVVDIPIADGNTIGVLKTSNVLGTSTNANGQLYLWKSDSQQIKSGIDNYRPIVASNQHESAFYGLAKASGDTTQSASSNAVGAYTDEAKASIQSMLGVTGVWENGTGTNAVKTKGATAASGVRAVAEGFGTTASGNNSHAEGTFSKSLGVGSHAEGYETSASYYAHSEGWQSVAAGDYSHTEGRGTKASRLLQHVFGEYNTEDLTGASAADRGSYIEIVGNGQDDLTRSNARTLDWSGNETLAGKLTVGAAPTADMDVATKGYVDGEITTVSNGTEGVRTGVANLTGYYPIDFLKKKLVTTRANIGDTVDLTIGSYDGADCVLTDCSAGDVFIITGYGWNAERLWAFFDANNVLLSISDANANVTNIEITAPENAAKLVINSRNAYPHSVFKRYTTTKLIGNVEDVQVNGTSIVTDGVANVPIANASTFGVVKINSNNGIGIDSNKVLYVIYPTDTQVKNGASKYLPLVPFQQHSATFYGLAKAAGDTTQSASSNAVGTYTDSAKSAIKAMLGTEESIATVEPTITASKAYAVGDLVVVNSKLYKVIAAIAQNDVFTEGTNVSETRVDTELNDKIGKTDYATESKAGIVFGKTSYGLGVNTESGLIYVARANSDQLKLGTHAYRPIVPADQHASTFYGLAKAAGDSTQSASSNAVGTYTPEAKSAIRNMLGVTETIDTVTVSGTAPVITASPNTRYVCGEVSTLSFTPCSTGICDVRFTSGSSVTILTLPQSVQMPEWFEIETNRIYEINIADGVYGGVMSWPITT